MRTEMTVRPYHPDDEDQVVNLWKQSNLVVPWNDPVQDIAMKVAWQPELFLVAVQNEVVVGTVMAGYDGHRGWLNYLASGRLGAGKLLVEAAEARLADLGCPKINLQVRETNKGVIRFYQKLGYTIDPLVSMGKRRKI